MTADVLRRFGGSIACKEVWIVAAMHEVVASNVWRVEPGLNISSWQILNFEVYGNRPG